MSIDGFTRGVENADKAPVLVVILHGWRSTPQMMEGVAQASRRALGADASGKKYRVDTYVPLLPYHRALSTKRAVDIVLDILRAIDEIDRQGGYARIVLAGHSMGATIARRVFLVAAANLPEIQSEKKLGKETPRAWAGKVDRIVLLAAFNRGWHISQRLSWKYSIGLNICGLLGHLAPRSGWVPTIFDIRLGAPFMVQTRLHWLAYRRQCLVTAAGNATPLPAATQPATPPPEPILIQLLGSRDDLISPFDQVDIAVNGNSSDERTYYLIQFEETDHNTAIRFTGSEAAEARGNLFVRALADSPAELGKIALKPELLIDEIDKPDDTVEQTVFVIHGIRDDGFWTHRVAERVRALTNPPMISRAWTPSYGYFAMLPFILPWIRRQKVEWFMDQYVSAVAQYPRSIFHYVGHSNGTYLAAKGLADYPACAFTNVLFAGSVVRSDYDWKTLVERGRVARVLNVVASADWVVALLPKSLEHFRKFDLGGAGFDGFRQAKKAAATHPGIAEREFVRGSHGAGIAEGQWENIAQFIVNGHIPTGDDPAFVKRQPRWLKALSDTRATLWVAAACFGLAVPAAIVSSRLDAWLGLPSLASLPNEDVVRAIALVIYLLVLKFIITRV
ncbi:alpha/beta fold hydrolase [Mesorhizobium sp. B2-3-4]|uniref:alpha/beta fold hydrolase n=1 Tax=Mesorhizobium sp. B2-3-4 TaxID=2589959 RepID=UPI0015E2EB6D|nr:alpha/beta fold hydrolase [Mesorhizobium sp. B2-3-4]